MSAPGPQRRAPRGAVGDRRCPVCKTVLAADNKARLCGRCLKEQLDQPRTPPKLSDEFFETDDFRAAFASQKIGNVFKVYRHHPHHLKYFGKSLNQETFGKWLGLEQSQVSKIESGKTDESIKTLQNWARILHLPQHLLWFDLPGQSRLNSPQSSRGTGKLLSISSGPAMDRREFMLFTSGTVLGMTESLHRGLSSRAGQSDLGYLLHRTARLRRLDNYLGGRDTYNLYVSELASTVGYVRNVNCGPNIRKTLIKIIAEQAQLAGWAAFDAGMHVEAKKHYSDSLEAAREANDAALMGNALAFLAYQEVSTIGPNVELAEASFAAAEKEATPKVRALLLERKAWTYAVAGDYQATNRALADAKTALRIKTDQPEPDWVFWVDDNEIDIMTGRCLTELHRPLEAASALDVALLRFDDTYARDKALYMTFLANALIDGEEIERAAMVTAKSIELAQGVGSVRPSARITGVMHKLREFKDLESVSQLFEQVRD